MGSKVSCSTPSTNEQISTALNALLISTNTKEDSNDSITKDAEGNHENYFTFVIASSI